MKAPIISITPGLASLATILFVASTAYAMPADETPTQLEVSSPAFNAHQEIPAEYTCEGGGAAPALSWSKPPAGTRSIAIVVEDTDAPRGTFTHWMVTGISPALTHLAKGGATPTGAFAATNDMGKTGYTAPCPTDGTTHHYHFHVYALDIRLDKPIAKTAFSSKIQGHVLAQGERRHVPALERLEILDDERGIRGPELREERMPADAEPRRVASIIAGPLGMPILSRS